MKRFRLIILIILVGAILVGGGLFLVGYFRPQGAGIFIETVPAASVIIEGEQVGRTPYKETRSPGEITVKLVPESFEQPLAPYETKVTLVSGIETVVRRELGASEELSSGEVLSFEKIGGSETSLSIVSTPDSAQISIDGTTKAFSPYKTSALAAGKHNIKLAAPGFLERNLELKTFKGYKLTALIKLAKEPNPDPVDDPVTEDPVVEKKPDLVKISSTPTGFLRVRSEPSTLGEEVGRVEPGEQFELLDTDEATGWYKIAFEEGEEGWISNTYSEVVSENDAQPTSTPPPTPTESE